MFQEPILFIIFNRPEISFKAFSEIRKVQPQKLFIAQDGAREGKNEDDIIQKTRKTILDNIDWECEVKTLFQSSNLGCGIGVFTAIQWFFDNVERGIIIEDDCIVNSSFFPFMEEMLEKYKDDQRIGMIAGTNPIKGVNYNFSYHFSRFKSCWGWATWKRAWKNMDINMEWRKMELDSILNNSGFNGQDLAKWRFQLNYIDNKFVSAWDWQWYFSLAAQNQLCIYPKVNLVSNIGNDSNATHTSFSNITLKNEELSFPLKHPTNIVPNVYFDKAFYKRGNTFFIKLSRLIPYKFKKKTKIIINKLNNYANN